MDIGKSFFYLCLNKDYYEEAKFIYHKFKNTNISFFNSIILNYIIENKDPKKIIEFLNEFKDEIDFNLFNIEQNKSLIHYICIFLSDDIHTNVFSQLFSFIFDNLKIDFSLKDEYNRTFLFYLFLDQNDNIKITDPIQNLMCISQKYKFNNLNDKDIFGNNLIFYAVQSIASRCIDFLLNNGIILYNNILILNLTLSNAILFKRKISIF